jgi:hypothetical protein
MTSVRRLFIEGSWDGNKTFTGLNVEILAASELPGPEWRWAIIGITVNASAHLRVTLKSTQVGTGFRRVLIGSLWTGLNGEDEFSTGGSQVPIDHAQPFAVCPLPNTSLQLQANAPIKLTTLRTVPVQVHLLARPMSHEEWTYHENGGV